MIIICIKSSYKNEWNIYTQKTCCCTLNKTQVSHPLKWKRKAFNHASFIDMVFPILCLGRASFGLFNAFGFSSKFSLDTFVVFIAKFVHRKNSSTHNVVRRREQSTCTQHVVMSALSSGACAECCRRSNMKLIEEW